MSTKYYPYGERRNSQGDLGTDKLFTRQRLDDTGLYYYGARYYDATIGRFISADTVVSQPANPQAFNRYSYVLNNPLKYIDPTGHQDDDPNSVFNDWYYGNLCESAGVDPDEGLAIFVGEDGKIIGTVDPDTFERWVEETPNPYDYLSKGGVLSDADRALGITGALYYHMDLKAIPIPVYLVGDKGFFSELLGDWLGMSLYPFGTFVKESARPLDQWIAHEGKHYSEQRMFGAFVLAWYAAYVSEIAVRSWVYKDRFEGYYQSSFEHRARDWAGQGSSPPPSPWWDNIDLMDRLFLLN